MGAWDRALIWKTSARLAWSHPFGVGLGSFGNIFNPVTPRPGVGTDYAHSEPLQVLVETGWPGMLLTGWLITMLWRGANVNLPVAGSSVSAIAALAVFVALDFPLHVPGLALSGLLLVISLMPVKQTGLRRPRRLHAFFLLAVVVTMGIWMQGLAMAEVLYAYGYRLYTTDPAAAERSWRSALVACPEYDPPRQALERLHPGGKP